MGENRLVTDFLYWNKAGGPGSFPLENFVIGVEFEVGGCYENWGWCVYQKKYSKEIKRYYLEPFVCARGLKSVIEKAIEKLKNERA